MIGFFSANKKKTGKSWTTNPADIDIPHYKQLLWNTIDEVLQIAGYPVEQLAKDFGVKLDRKNRNGNGNGNDNGNGNANPKNSALKQGGEQ